MKTALITGISRGIGRALAQKFLAEGYAVLGTTQAGTADLGDANLSIYKLDLGSPASVAACAASIADSGANIDVLINNAGVLLDENETRLNPDRLRDTLEVNVVGTAGFTERMLPRMNADGHIINLSSQAGSLADMDAIEDSHEPYHYPAYKISKSALNMYTRTLAARLAHEGSGIIVSSVHPGWVRTDMGGSEAPVLPEEAAADIFDLAVSRPETGQFWFKGEKFPW